MYGEVQEMFVAATSEEVVSLPSGFEMFRSKESLGLNNKMRQTHPD